MESDKGQMGPAYLLSEMSVVLFVQPSPLISSLPSQTPHTVNRLIVAQIYIAFSYFLEKLHPSFISIIITTQRTLRIEQAAIAPLWSERDVERSLHQCSL